MDNLLFYKIECFKCDTLILFKDIESRVIHYFWYDAEFVNTDKADAGELSCIIQDNILIGYNNYHYDDLILSKIMQRTTQDEVFQYSDSIMNNDVPMLQIDARIRSLDCSQQIDSSKPSLSKIIGNMGKNIQEPYIPAGIDRPLTDTEKNVVFQYCSNAVDCIIQVYKQREHSYFESKITIAEMLGISRSYRWNTTTISANILLNKDSNFVQLHDLTLLDKFWKQNKDISPIVWDLWKTCEEAGNHMISKQTSTFIYGCKFTFGFGGLHGENSSIHEFNNVMLLDVSSMYPSIIVNLNILGEATRRYDTIRKKRLEMKHSDQILSNAYKLIINSVYGNLKNQYSKLYNPMASNIVCIYGQIALFDLCGRLYKAGYTLVNINTDGVGFIGDGDEYKCIWNQWELDYNLKLEFSAYDHWIQRDVNNYIAIAGDETKAKGEDVNKVFENQYFKNNDARIIQIALMEYLLHGTSVIDTLLNHLNEPILYQYVLCAGSSYDGTVDSKGTRMQNVNRVFAVKPAYAGNKLYKVCADGTRINFNDVPDYMMIWNKDVNDLKDFRNIVDLNHYYQKILKKIRRWKTV